MLRPLTLAVLATLLIWLGVIVYWQETVRLVTPEDVALYLIGLPLAIVGAAFALRAGYRAVARAREPQAADQAATAEVPAARTDEQERAYALTLMAVGLASAGGQSAAETHDALKGREIQPAPDPELRDLGGFPLRSARLPSLDTDDLAAWLEQREPACGPGVIRALCLLERALEPVKQALTPLAPVADAPSNAPAATQPRLFFELLVPMRWDEATRALALHRALACIAESGWPSELCTSVAIAADHGSLALRQLDAFCSKANLQASQGVAADLYLLAACDSLIDQDAVLALENAGMLYTAAQQQGRVPGEAAAAILAGVPKGAAPAEPPIALARRAAVSARSKPADAQGRIGHDTLLETAQRSLALAQLQPADIALVVSDVGTGGSRGGECASAVTDLLPELDPVKQCIGTGEALGHLGASGTLIALSVAAAAVQAEGKPVMLLTVSHPTERAAVVLVPPAAPTQTAAQAA